MQEGDVVLTPVPQADGRIKTRPALLLRILPGFGDFLLCGISSQLQHSIADFDEMISPDDSDFKGSGLRGKSLIRLGFLAVISRRKVPGAIGSISPQRHRRMLERLATFLLASRALNNEGRPGDRPAP